MVSHVEICLPKKPPTPKNIGDAVGGPQREFWKEALFVQYEHNKLLAFSQLPYQSNIFLQEQNSSVHSLLLLLRKVTVIMHGNLLHATVKMGVLILKVLILINNTVQWHILTHSESTLLLHICIGSLPGF